MRSVVSCKSEVWILTAVVVVLLFGFVLRPGTDLACAGPDGSRVITPDYGNTFFKKAKTPSPGFEIVRVYDSRGGAHDAVGTTRSEEGDDRVPLALSEPVSDFARRGLEMMLSVPEETDHPIKVEVEIQQFEANFEKVFLGNKCLFLARIEVKIVSDIGSTTVGWLENLQEYEDQSDVRKCQETSMYRAVAAFAQGLAYGKLPLEEVAEKIRTGAPVDWDPIIVRVGYRQPWEIGAEFPWGVRLVYHGFATSDMKDSYDHCFCFMAEGVGWLRERAGFRLEAGFLLGSGLPRPGNPKWHIEESELSMFAIPIHGTILYRVRKGGTPHVVSPYVGLGGGVYLGVEKLAAKANDGYESFEGHLRALRACGAVHGVLGVELRQAQGRCSGVLELRWTKSGDGGATDFLTDEEREEFEETLFDAVRRPSFSFTGWSVEVGMRFYRDW